MIDFNKLIVVHMTTYWWMGSRGSSVQTFQSSICLVEIHQTCSGRLWSHGERSIYSRTKF